MTGPKPSFLSLQLDELEKAHEENERLHNELVAIYKKRDRVLTIMLVLSILTIIGIVIFCPGGTIN